MNSEKYISSAKRIHLAIFILAITSFITISYDYSRDVSLHRLAMYEHLLSLFKEDGQPRFEQMHRADLTEVYFDAAFELINLRIQLSHLKLQGASENEIILAEENLKKYDKSVIPNAYIIRNISTRLSPRVVCNASVFQHSKKGDDIISFYYGKPHSELVPRQSIFLVNFGSECVLSRLHLDSILIIKSNEDAFGWLYGLPPQGFELLRNKSFLFLNEIKADKLSFLQNYYDPVKYYASISDEYFIVSNQMLETNLFQDAADASGKFRRRDDLSGALDDLESSPRTYTPVFGIPAPIKLFLQVSPLFVFGLSYTLYYRLRVIRRYRVKHTEPWIMIGNNNAIQFSVATIWALVPISALLLVYFVFSDLHNIRFYSISNFTALRSVFGWHSRISTYTMTPLEEYFANFIFALFLINSYFSIKISYYYIQLIFRRE